MLGATALAVALPKLSTRLALSRAKHRSLAGHSRMARRLAAFIPFYEYDGERFFRSDDAPAEIAARRQAGFLRLSGLFRARFAESVRVTAETADGLSDLQFTSAYRVPFQFSRTVREHLKTGGFVQ